MIKIARFMIVQQAVELEDLPSSDEDSNCDSDDELVRPPKDCLSLVTEMMDRFMI